MRDAQPYSPSFWTEAARWLRHWLRSGNGFAGNGRDVALQPKSSDDQQAQGREVPDQNRKQLALQTVALEAASDAIVITDRFGTVTWVNPAFTQLTGYSAAEVIGKTPRVWSSHLQTPDYYEPMWEAILSGSVWHGEIINRRKDGIFYREEMTITPVRANNGEICNFVATKRDTTARDQAEKELFLAQFAVEHAADAIFWADAVGRISNVNEAACSYLGYAREELIALHVWDLEPSVRREDWHESWLRLKRQGSLQKESIHARKDGSTVPVEVVVTYLDFHGTERAFTLVRNISERRKAQDELRRAEQRYRQIFENVPIGIFRSTPDGRLLEVNPGMARLLDYSTPEEQIASITDIARDLYVSPARRAELASLVDTQEVVRDFEMEAIQKDGRRVSLLCDFRAIRDSGGKILHYDGMARDVTENKFLEAQLRQAQKMEAIGRLAGGVAHDFNNLLTVVTGYSEILIQRLSGEKTLQSKVLEIRNAAQRAADLTHQLLAFSRQQVLQPRVMNINPTVAETIKMLKRLIGEDIELVFRPDPELGLTKVDPGQIIQIIMNLAVNARDAMPSGGKLIIETGNTEFPSGYVTTHPGARPGEQIRLSVTDTGVGMDGETLCRIFEPFFTTKGPDKGTGLGLSIVYGIVKQSEGYIATYSEKSVGTSFKIYFPRVYEVISETEPTKAKLLPATHSETLLVVEDQSELRPLLRDRLEGLGYRVIEASNGSEALEAAASEQGPIHALITDVIMPGMNGRELAERLTTIRPTTKVVYISGYTNTVICERGVLPQGFVLIEKPFAFSVLASTLDQVLGNPRN
jgi:two-component system, cell cycle sensor histidine kinase and response regulator CckA